MPLLDPDRNDLQETGFQSTIMGPMSEMMDPMAMAQSRSPRRARSTVAPAHLTRHVVTLDDGHQVGVAVAGRGIPLVIVHGFGTDSLLYAQPLGRLAAQGFRVVAIDAAGHGATETLGRAGLEAYSELLGRAIEHLGIRHAVLAGHSMGGRLVAGTAAEFPDRVLTLLLLDAIVGAQWDRLQARLRWVPGWLGLYGVAFVVDGLETVPLNDPRQALKLGRRAAHSIAAYVSKPWRSMTPGLSIVRSGPSVPILDALGKAGVPVVAIHGERDLLVPLATASDAAARTHGELVVVKGASHSWLLRCPETLPSIVEELLHGGTIGLRRDALLRKRGINPARAGVRELERVCYVPDARVLSMGPGPERAVRIGSRRREPQYDWEWVRVDDQSGRTSA